jgi:putative hydrolase of the HAD superfamily
MTVDRQRQSFENVRTVFLDIDDTLWENNLFFLESLEWVCREGRRLGHTDRATVNMLNHWETFNIRNKGFGYDSYEASLLLTIGMLTTRAGRPLLRAALHRQGLEWTAFLKTHPIRWLDGVKETLPKLTAAFQTIIVTKGSPKDQMDKVNRCGLKHLFHGAEVVPHKYPSCYTGLLRKYGLQAEQTVMVGNSPRSDINMAKRAGLRTIYVPHPKTWYREMEPILSAGPPTVQVRRFPEVMDVLG